MNARFHVVVVIGKDFMHQQGAFIACGEVNIGKGGKQGLINKFKEFITGHAFIITRPLIPVQVFGDGGEVVVLNQFQFFIFIAEYF